MCVCVFVGSVCITALLTFSHSVMYSSQSLQALFSLWEQQSDWSIISPGELICISGQAAGPACEMRALIAEQLGGEVSRLAWPSVGIPPLAAIPSGFTVS